MQLSQDSQSPQAQKESVQIRHEEDQLLKSKKEALRIVVQHEVYADAASH